MGEMINPRIDLAFKKIFGVEQNKDMLISLINSIVSDQDQVDEIELLNPYNEKNFKKDKLSVLDIKARNAITKTYFLIEMQIAEELDYAKRSLFTWARVYSNQIGEGDHYGKLKKTIAIHILNFTFINYDKTMGWIESSPEKYHHRFVLADVQTRIEVFKDIEIHTIELNKFQAIEDDNLDVIMSKVKGMLDKWIVVLTKYNLLDSKKLPEKIDVPEIKKAIKTIQEASLTSEEREAYNSRLDFFRIEEGAFAARFAAGKAEGLAEGKAEGKAEGLLEGKLLIARNLLSKGLDISFISETTGLSEEEIRNEL